MKRNEPFSILYEDEHFIAVNKASGLLVAQDRWDPEAPRLDTLLSNAVCKEGSRLFAVHRIDKDTSGIVLYAKTAEAHRALSIMFEERDIKKTYHALVHGRPLQEEFSIDAPLKADGDAYHRTIKDARRGKDSLTHFTLIGVCGPYSWIEAQPITGRTHQIRVHLTIAGFSIVCDSLYGSKAPLYLSKIKRRWQGDEFEERPLLDRLALHAWKLEFAHPITKEPLCITAPYPKDLHSTRNQLSKLYKVDPLAKEHL